MNLDAMVLHHQPRDRHILKVHGEVDGSDFHDTVSRSVVLSVEQAAHPRFLGKTT